MSYGRANSTINPRGHRLYLSGRPMLSAQLASPMFGAGSRVGRFLGDDSSLYDVMSSEGNAESIAAGGTYAGENSQASTGSVAPNEPSGSYANPLAASYQQLILSEQPSLAPGDVQTLILSAAALPQATQDQIFQYVAQTGDISGGMSMASGITPLPGQPLSSTPALQNLYSGIVQPVAGGTGSGSGSGAAPAGSMVCNGVFDELQAWLTGKTCTAGSPAPSTWWGQNWPYVAVAVGVVIAIGVVKKAL